MNKAGSGKKTSQKGSKSQPVFSADDWISMAEAARLRAVSPQAIAKLVAKGRLATLEIAGKTLVRKAEVEAFQPAPGGRPRGT